MASEVTYLGFRTNENVVNHLPEKFTQIPQNLNHFWAC